MRSLLVAQGMTILWLSMFWGRPSATRDALVQGDANYYPLYTFLALTILGTLEWIDSSNLGRERWPYLSAIVWFAWGATVFLQAMVLVTLPTQVWPLVTLCIWLAAEAIRLSYFIQHRWTV